MNMDKVSTLIGIERGIKLLFKPRNFFVVDSGMSLDQEGEELWRDITLENKNDENEFYSFSFSTQGNLICHDDNTPSDFKLDLKCFLKDC